MIDFLALTAQGWMELISLVLCLPLVLLMNFALFQYLLTMFYRRRREPLVALLLAVAFLSFASLVPFGFPDTELVRDLNDISETCSVLTFLLQISILTRDVNKKLKLRSLVFMLYVGELLVLFGLIVVALNMVDLGGSLIDISKLEVLDDLVENLSLVFIVAFRFSFLAMAKGARGVLKAQRTEIVCYLLFLTHEYPFMVLDRLTRLSWEHVQGVWMRATIVMCLWMTIRTRLSSRNSRHAGRTSTMGQTTHADPMATPTKRLGPSIGPSEATTVGGQKRQSWVQLRGAATVAPIRKVSVGGT